MGSGQLAGKKESGQLAVGSWQWGGLRAEGRKRVGSGQLAVGSWQLAVGSWQLGVGSGGLTFWDL